MIDGSDIALNEIVARPGAELDVKFGRIALLGYRGRLRTVLSSPRSLRKLTTASLSAPPGRVPADR
jgi:hypothetical protein